MFELHIVDAKGGIDRVELSNLTPAQYVQHHRHAASESVTYTATLMCRGNTSAQNFCPNPKAK